MQRAKPMLFDGGDVLCRGIAFVVLEAVRGVFERPLVHERIALDFRDDRGGGNRRL